MTTDKIAVYSDGGGAEKAMKEAERVAAFHGMNEEDAMFLRLLAEEMMGLVRAITGSFEGDFWIESDDTDYRLCLRADTCMDKEKKKEMIALSSRRKNESTVGIMEMIRHMMEGHMIRQEDEKDDPMDPFYLGTVGMREADALSGIDMEWSLLQYRCKVEESRTRNEEMEEAWDQLEKSIVANVADDVRVGVRGDIVELTIRRHFGK